MEKNKLIFEYKAKETLSNFDFQMKEEETNEPEKILDKDVEVSIKGSNLVINVKADRHGSESSAKTYDEFVNGASHKIHTAKGSNEPSKLNFTVTGVLTINDDEFDICIGQGHYTGENNWHVCSESIIAKSNNKGGELLVAGKALADQFYLEPSGSNKFIIKNVSQLSGSHDNVFELNFKKGGIEEIDFKLDEAEVTVGQPFGGVETSVEDGVGIIVVKAGREKSKAVATWFDKQIDEGSCVSSFAAGKYPAELNFSIRGTLKFKTNGDEIIVKNYVLGQGSNVHLQNNWWLGGPQMKGLKIPYIPSLGGGLGMIGLSKGIVPKLILCKSILNTNGMTMHFVKIKKEIKLPIEITPELLEVEE